MEKTNVVVLDPAQREIEEIITVHRQLVGSESGRRIADRIYGAFERLVLFPLSGVLHHDKDLRKAGYSMLIIGKYLCIYRMIGETVYIYHVVHGATDYPRLFKELNTMQEE